MRQVYLAADPVNAEIVKDHLASHGIAAVVQGALLWGGRGDLPLDTFPTVWVIEDEHFQQARELCLEWERPRANAPGWTCPQCEERLAGQFTECWHCGYVRDP